jgi:hypothetical protein
MAKPLSELCDSVKKECLTLNENERNVSAVMAKLEAGVLQRFASFQHE